MYTLSSTPVSKRIRVRLTSVPSTAEAVFALCKLKCPGMPLDGSEPSIYGSDNALIAMARGDMMIRQRQRNKASQDFQEAAAHIASLVEQERNQSASIMRVIPSVEPMNSFAYSTKGGF